LGIGRYSDSPYSDNRYSDKMPIKKAQLNETVKCGLNVEILRSGSALTVE